MLQVNVSPVTTVIESQISSNSAIISIDNLSFITPIVNFKPDAFRLEVKVKPIISGSSTDDINLNGTIEIFYSDAYKDNIVLSF